MYLICPDKFKGSLNAEEVCQSLAKGIQSVDKCAEIVLCPLADGGEGSLDIAKKISGFEIKLLPTVDPIGRHIIVPVGIIDNICFIETAAIIGLHLLSPAERNPLITSTEGIGQLLDRLITEGFRTFHLFLGGSSTNDGGTGMAEALGYRFLNSTGNTVKPNGENLHKIHSIQPTKHEFDELKFVVYSDVSHTMYGKNGAAYSFAAQKGADSLGIVALDAGLRNLAVLLERDLKKCIADIPGSGAAGALAAGFIAFLNAEIRSGTEFFIHITELEHKIVQADLVITGEGKIDESSFNGKVTGKIQELCKKLDRKLIMVCGQYELSKIKTYIATDTEIFNILQYANNMESAFSDASEYLLAVGRDIAKNHETSKP